MNKDFKSFPVRPIRMSDKTWELLKKKKCISGKTWDKFIKELLELIEKKT